MVYRETDCFTHEQEPLAVLADRKGYWKIDIKADLNKNALPLWEIVIEKLNFDVMVDNFGTLKFTGGTYHKVESTAREFLNNREDI